MLRYGFLLLLLFVVLLFLPTASHGVTWHVRLDGSGDAITIQGGMELASAGDTVLVGCGTYQDCTHLDGSPPPWDFPHCVLLRPGVTLRSETGDPGCVTIDAQGQGRVVRVMGLLSVPGTRLEGLTLRGGTVSGSATPVSCGAGLLVGGGSQGISVVDCVFVDNTTGHLGGGAYVDQGSPTFSGCVFLENDALQGGGVYANLGTQLFQTCRFVRNSAGIGGGFACAGGDALVESGIFDGNVAGVGGGGNPSYGGGAVYTFGIGLIQGRATLRNCTLWGNSWVDAAGGGGAGVASAIRAAVTLERTIIAGSSAGAAAYCVGASTITVSCSDIWGNAGGDWVGCIASQAGSNGNLSYDPDFCASWMGDLRLATGSPCLPANNPCQALIGAEGEGCSQPVGAAEPLPTRTWAQLKSGYR